MDRRYLDKMPNKSVKATVLSNLEHHHFSYDNNTCYGSGKGYECFVYTDSDLYTLRFIVPLRDYKEKDNIYNILLYTYIEHGCGGEITSSESIVSGTSEDELLENLLDEVEEQLKSFVTIWLEAEDDYYFGNN